MNLPVFAVIDMRTLDYLLTTEYSVMKIYLYKFNRFRAYIDKIEKI